MFGKTPGMRMARVVPVEHQPFAVGRNAPEQAAVFQLGVFLNMNAVYQHDANLIGLLQRGKIIHRP